MVLNGDLIEHRRFYEIVDYLQKGDVLVLNDSKVIPAKLVGKKTTGGKVECLLLKREGKEGICLIRGKKIRPNMEIVFHENFTGKVLEKVNGRYRVKFSGSMSLDVFLDKFGKPPLPPYIKKELEREKYQTVYATKPGSIAAPTAGFHFTHELLEKIRRKGVEVSYVTLHIGIGTFSPVKVENIEDHKMESEYFEITEENAAKINKAERVIACGTTAVKVLESAASENGNITPMAGWSDLFIYPPYCFKSRIDGLITNFHLPKSTLLMLVCAYAGRKRILNAYKVAVKEGYRFYSFGDAMFIKGAGSV
jgi:S-adenosylmethionine:tRNA ribosyltransferase-isomerase